MGRSGLSFRSLVDNLISLEKKKILSRTVPVSHVDPWKNYLPTPDLDLAKKQALKTHTYTYNTV